MIYNKGQPLQDKMQYKINIVSMSLHEKARGEFKPLYQWTDQLPPDIYYCYSLECSLQQLAPLPSQCLLTGKELCCEWYIEVNPTGHSRYIHTCTMSNNKFSSFKQNLSLPAKLNSHFFAEVVSDDREINNLHPYFHDLFLWIFIKWLLEKFG